MRHARSIATGLAAVVLGGALGVTTLCDAATKKKAATQPKPGMTAAELTADQKSVSDARSAYNSSLTAIDLLVGKLTADFETSPDATAAKQAIKDAQTALETAKGAVREKLKQKPEYVKAVDAELAGSIKLQKMKADGAPDAEVSAQSAEVLQLGNTVGVIEKAAFDVDPGVTDAQKNLTDASTKFSALRTAFKAGIKDNGEFQAAVKTRDDAQKTLSDALSKQQTDTAKVTPVQAY